MLLQLDIEMLDTLETYLEYVNLLSINNMIILQDTNLSAIVEDLLYNDFAPNYIDSLLSDGMIGIIYNRNNETYYLIDYNY